MKDIIIVCAGSYGKEMYYTIRKINQAAKKDGKEEPYNLLGFINDIPDALDNTEIDLPILGTIKDWKPVGHEAYALGLGKPSSKKEVVEKLKDRGCQFETIIAPYVILPEDLIIGEGCLIKAYHIASGVKIGNYVNMHGSMIMPGAVIGDYSTTTGFAVVENASIGEGVYVGSHAVVTEGVTVGSNVNISAGSIVTKDIPSDKKVFGFPAVESQM
ncbi:MAG: hypothetical protein J6K48_00130 [Lachnospiraceae bacterium]|nr:hypothetical protein [Lachnospiraceae bacterium]